MAPKRFFILKEAVALVPLVRCILLGVREHRAKLSRLKRLLERADLEPETELTLRQQYVESLEELQENLADAQRLGVEITPGVRCEAWFPFEHRWVGEFGDQKIRPAYFVYNDSQQSIKEWIFAGWPNDRRLVAEKWLQVSRPTRETDASSNA